MVREINQNEMALFAVGRGNFYWLLAGFFLKGPKKPLVELLRQTSLGEGIPVKYVQLTEEELEEEFQRFFVVPGPDYIPPYESVYKDRWEIPTCTLAGGEGPILSATGLMWGPSTVAVKREYEETGFILASNWNEPPDHLGIELEWMSHLCEMECHAWQKKSLRTAQRWKERQRAFLRDHLLSWVPDLHRAIERSSMNQFYRYLVGQLDEFLRWEVKDIEQRQAMKGVIEP